MIMICRSIHQEDLVANLKQALTQDSIPEITQTILNLAEFMEHCEEATVSMYREYMYSPDSPGKVHNMMYFCSVVIHVYYCFNDKLIIM